jgi:hypothetical protein
MHSTLGLAFDIHEESMDVFSNSLTLNAFNLQIVTGCPSNAADVFIDLWMHSTFNALTFECLEPSNWHWMSIKHGRRT